jgi:cysteinyl-tRNA synthetase
MIATIEAIISNGHGYALEDGDVYFDVASLPGYGRLSGRSQVCRGLGGEECKTKPCKFESCYLHLPGTSTSLSSWC